MSTISTTVNEQGPPGVDGVDGVDATVADNRTIVNDATEDFGSVIGIYTIFGTTSIRKKCEVMFDGSDADVVALTTEGANTYSATVDTAGKINIFVVGSNLMIQNKTGGDFDLSTRRLV